MVLLGSEGVGMVSELQVPAEAENIGAFGPSVKELGGGG